MFSTQLTKTGLPASSQSRRACMSSDDPTSSNAELTPPDTNETNPSAPIEPPNPINETRVREQAEVNEYRESIRIYRRIFNLEERGPDEYILNYLKVILNPENVDFIRTNILANIDHKKDPYDFGILTDIIYGSLGETYQVGSLTLDCNNSEIPTRLNHINIILSSIYDGSSREREYLAQNPRYIPSELAISIALSEPYTLFAEKVAANPNYIPDERAERLALEHSHSRFAYKITENPNYTPSNNAIRFALSDPNNAISFNIASSQNYVPSEEAVRFALSNQDTSFASGIGRNPNFIPSEETERNIIRGIDNNFKVSITRNPNYTPNEEARRYMIVQSGTRIASALVACPNYIPTEEVINIAFSRLSHPFNVASSNPRDYFAEGLARNPNYIPDERAIRFAYANPDTIFAINIATNPNFREDIIRTRAVQRNSRFALAFVDSPNYRPGMAEAVVARNYPNTNLSAAIGKRTSFISSYETSLIVSGQGNAYTNNLLSNPHLFLPW